MTSEKSITAIVHVAVAIILDQDDKILISRRRQGTHLAGLWEFPGGKLETNETIEAALKREIKEELDIEIKTARPLIEVLHNYPEIRVKLDTWLVQSWSGIAQAQEGQQISWVKLQRLKDYEFPAADQPIIEALQDYFQGREDL